MTKVRFAPSPTGYIHIGNTRIALFNWLFAKKTGGQFVLRYDDTDHERSKQEYIDAIAIDLEWLGITPDQVEYQSKRFSRYDAVVEDLKTRGLLYPCYETPEELERRRKIQLSRHLPPVYGREALKLTAQEKEKYDEEGRKPHWRFLLPNFKVSPFERERTDVHWDDAVRGTQTIDLASMSDPVLVRADGTYLYTLPSVVDDIDMGITHIIRGDDHVTNTGVQIAIFEAIGAKIPTFGHINLLTTTSGEGLAKRSGALSIASLRREGYEPMAVASLAVLIGTSEDVHAYPTMEALAEHFDLKSVSKSAAKIDPADLPALNRHLIHDMPFIDAEKRLATLGINGELAEPFWNVIRSNIDKVSDAKVWWDILFDKPADHETLSPEDADFVKKSVAFLPPEPWGEMTWKEWTEALKEKTGRKGKQLFMPLRLALTGLEHGPELAKVLPLMGKRRVEERL